MPARPAYLPHTPALSFEVETDLSVKVFPDWIRTLWAGLDKLIRVFRILGTV